MGSKKAQKQTVSSAVFRSMRRAFELASEARHAEVTAAHLVAALLEEEDVSTAIVACGADRNELTDVALGSLDETRQRPWYRRKPKAHVTVDGILRDAVAHVMGSGLPEVTPILVLIQILDHDDSSLLAERLDAMGLEALALKRLVAHEMPLDRPATPTETLRAGIVLHDDPFTTREFVVEILVETFSMSEDQATELMLDAQRLGKLTVKTLDRDEALAAVESIQEKARNAGFPLMVSLVSPGKG